MRDSVARSIAKSLTWRVTATLTTILIAWLILGDIAPALAIGGIEFFAKIFVYYLHERAWTKVK